MSCDSDVALSLIESWSQKFNIRGFFLHIQHIAKRLASMAEGMLVSWRHKAHFEQVFALINSSTFVSVKHSSSDERQQRLV